jgi:hypothetical protein
MGRCQSPVNIFAMRHTQNQNRLAVVFDPANYPVVSETISPQTSFIARQSFSVLAGIALAGDSALKKANNAFLRGAAQPLEFTQSARFEVNRPGQAV